MPQRGVSKKKDRLCLICAGQTRVAFLGIDVCRACSVFYKRNEKRNEFTCRASTKNCPVGQDLNCKKCRFDHIERLLKHSGEEKASNQSITTSDPSSVDSQSPAEQIPESSPSTSCNSTRSELPILERLKIHYRTMCMIRLGSELNLRSNPPHPMEISLETGPFFPASFGTLNSSNRVLLMALIDFGSCMFSEYRQLDKKEKWDIVLNNFYRFRLFEGIYRAGIVFPDDLDITFAGYSTWASLRNLDSHCADAPTGDMAGVREYMKLTDSKMKETRAARELMQRVNPCHEEFLFVIALMFWSSGDKPVRDELTQLGERYHEEILKELHAFYREQKGLDDYAARLGELMMLLPVFDRSHDIKEHFEMLRLLDVLPEDNFTYQLQKAD